MTILHGFGARGLSVIEDVYPRPFDGTERTGGWAAPADAEGAARTVSHEGLSGVLLAFDARGLAEIARRAGCWLSLRPEVGDFVASGEVLCEVHGTRRREDFVGLAVSEIRLYGASSLQVSRRLHALLASLIEALPAERLPALRDELALLDRGVERAFDDPNDRHRARVADLQGIGASSEGVER